MDRLRWWCVNSVNRMALILLAAGAIYAQEVTGSIRGTVTDPSGACVQKAELSQQGSKPD